MYLLLSLLMYCSLARDDMSCKMPCEVPEDDGLPRCVWGPWAVTHAPARPVFCHGDAQERSVRIRKVAPPLPHTQFSPPPPPPLPRSPVLRLAAAKTTATTSTATTTVHNTVL